ncbi:hypothetical protein [Micromonospora sp. IBHARD004]|uniref:hypothetical protein n=1 Tax=Micromonospora sp. IBHARD004 TaxID=3457764 RepID=UPI004058DFA9
MSRIVDLWRQGSAPGVSGLYRVDGSAHIVRSDGPDLSFIRIGGAFDLDDLLSADPEEVAQIDESARVKLPDGSGFLCCGEGAHGSEGFFARLDPQENLIWMVFLRNGNPIIRIGIGGSRATFSNNLGRSISIDLADLHCRRSGAITAG